jgi:hypothetical protein
VELPDVGRGAFALSGIVLHSGEQAHGNGARPDPTAIPPSEALRTYAAGTQLAYAYEIYNASNQVRVTTTVWRGRDKILEVPPETLVAPNAHARRFAARGILKLGAAMPHGTYLLQLSAATPDAKKKGRLRTALQRIDFDVR